MKQPLLVPVVINCNDENWLSYSLEASKGFFKRYVIYDIGSTDASQDIIKSFVNSLDNVDLYVRMFNAIINPKIQGIFRNSMIAEARSEWYLVLDADEIYTPEGFEAILEQTAKLQDDLSSDSPMYGIIPRVEVAETLDAAYGVGQKIPHHRIYHRTAIWTGSHPGEIPFYNQKNRSRWFDGVTCYHFHNTVRSTKDKEVPKRLERRGRGTYRPGETEKFDLLKTLSILSKPIGDFPVNPELAKLQALINA